MAMLQSQSTFMAMLAKARSEKEITNFQATLVFKSLLLEKFK